MTDEELKKMHETCAGDGAPVFRAIIDAALEARAELARLMPYAEGLVSHARALAFKEAAQEAAELIGDWTCPNCDRDTGAGLADEVGADLRALAPLSPSLQAVPVEVVAKVRTLLGIRLRSMNEALQCQWCAINDGEHDPYCIAGTLEAALVLLREASR